MLEENKNKIKNKINSVKTQNEQQNENVKSHKVIE